jgi:hypothetical protein
VLADPRQRELQIVVADIDDERGPGFFANAESALNTGLNSSSFMTASSFPQAFAASKYRASCAARKSTKSP